MAKHTSQGAGITARIPIWSSGEFTALNGEVYKFSEADLQASAGAYNPALFRAPWVKGHPKTNDPAFGWGDQLEWDGEYLWANSSQIDPAFAEEVRAGRWGKISPTFLSPNHPKNPVPGVWYLKNIGWLGAHAPANTDLPAPEFADGDADLVSFADGVSAELAEFGERERWGFQAIASWMRRLRESLIERNGREEADDQVPEYLIQDIEAAGAEQAPETESLPAAFSEPEQEETLMSEANQEAEFAERETALNTRSADLDAREQALHQQETEHHQSECAEFADGLVGQGRLLPRDRDGVVALLTGLDAETVVEFGEGEERFSQPSGEWMRNFLQQLPVQVEFGEHAKPGAEGTDVVEFAAPDGCQVDKDRADLHGKALAYQRDHDCDYVTAVQAVGG